MKRFFKILGLILLGLIIGVFLVFYTPDIKQEDLEDIYFTENSSYHDVSILSLEGQSLDITVHYQDYGNDADPVIVLLHGAFSSSHTFIPWTMTLIQSGYRVILPDLPYFGLTGGFDDQQTSLRRSGEMVIALLDILEIESFHIGGNSLGGGVSWYLASEYPTRVLSLVLIDAVAGSLDGEERRVPAFLTSDFFSSIISQMTPRFLVRSILKTAYGHPEILDEVIFQRYFDLLRRDNTRQWILQVKQEREPDWNYDDRLNAIETPTLVMWGEKDQWIPVDVLDIFKEALSLGEDDIIIYPELGHVPMEEEPSTVFDYLTFLGSLS